MTPIALTLAGLALGACGRTAAGGSGVRGDPRQGPRAAAGRTFTVTCLGAAAWYTGPCLDAATMRCDGGRAQFLGALSSTYLKANRLYLTTTRHRCRGA